MKKAGPSSQKTSNCLRSCYKPSKPPVISKTFLARDDACRFSCVWTRLPSTCVHVCKYLSTFGFCVRYMAPHT